MNKILFLMIFYCNIIACTPLQKSLEKIIKGIDSTTQGYFDSANLFFSNTQATIKKYYSLIEVFDEENRASMSLSLQQLDQLNSKMQKEAIGNLSNIGNDLTNKIKSVSDRLESKAISLDMAEREILANKAIFEAQAKSTMLNLKKLINPQLASLLALIDSKLVNLDRQKNIDDALVMEKSWLEHQKETRIFFEKIFLILPLLEQVTQSMNIFMASYGVSMVLKTNDYADIIKRYQDVLSQFFAVYKAFGKSVDFADKSNLVSATMSKILNMYYGDISVSLKKAHIFLKKGSKNDYYQSLYDLSGRLSGGNQVQGIFSQGYDAQVALLAQSFFTKNQQNLVLLYKQKKRDMTLNKYVDALQDITINVANPSDEQLSYALSFYNEIMINYPLLDDKRIIALEKLINVNMGIIYIAKAQNLLKSMSMSSDNKDLKQNVFDAYKKACEYAQKSRDESFYQRASMLMNSFGQALSLQAEAKKNESIDLQKALDDYQRAYVFFAQSGDSVSAQEMSTIINTLQSQRNIDSIQTIFENYITTHKSQIQEYFLTLNSPDIQRSLISFEGMYQDFIDVHEKAINLCASLNNNYIELGINTNDVKNLINVLSQVKEAITLLLQGDEIARSKTIEGLNSSQNNYYSQVLVLLKQSDEAYNSSVFLKTIMKIYKSFLSIESLNDAAAATGIKEENFLSIAQKHIAKNFIEIAQGLQNNGTVALQYYLAADGSRSIYLSAAVDQFLTATIEYNKTNYLNAQQIFEQTKQRENEALQFTINDWACKSEIPECSSSANDSWKDITQGYFLSFRLSISGAAQYYSRALSEYADAYEKNVPVYYYPHIGSALIYYKLYLLTQKVPDLTAKDIVISKISNATNIFFEEINNLLKNLKAADLLKTSTFIQNEIVRWQQRFDVLLDEQQTALRELSLNDDSLLLWKKSIDSQSQATTYSFNEGSGGNALSVAIDSPEQTYATLYAKIADRYFSEKNYLQASENYLIARDYFGALKNQTESDRMRDLYNISYTKSLVDAYRRLVIPHDQDTHQIPMVTVASLAVPEHYELYNYVQEIPTYIPISLTLQELIKSGSSQATEAIENILINYAYLLYIDNILRDHGIAYDDVFNGYDLRAQPALSDDKKSLILGFLDEAKRYAQLLKSRISAGKASLHLQGKQNTATQTSFFLAESYKPIPVFPLPGLSMTTLPYTSFPTVVRYYESAKLLSDPQKKLIQLGGKSFVSANDSMIFEEMSHKIAKAYLSAANQYKKRVEFLIQGGDDLLVDSLIGLDEIATLTHFQAMINAVKKIDKTDMSVDMSLYAPGYELIKKYVDNVIASYYSQALAIFQQFNDTQQLDMIRQSFGDLAVLLGDSAQIFLVGDPRSVNYFWGSNNIYGGILYDIKNAYMKAIGYYGQKSSLVPLLLSKAGNLFKQAGDLLVDQKNYFASIIYYAMSLGAYRAVVPLDEKKLAQAVITWLSSYYKGATANIMAYRAAKIAPIVLTLSTGVQESISLEQLLLRGQAADPVEQESYESLKNILLDSIIYYNGCSSAAYSFVPQKQSIAQSVKQSPESNVIDDEAIKILATYTKKYELSLDTLSSVTNLLVRNDFEESILSVFDDIAQAVLNAVDENQRAVGYSALSKFANKLFFALGEIYMHDYLGGKQPEEQYTGLMQALKAEEQAIIAPADQWID